MADAKQSKRYSPQERAALIAEYNLSGLSLSAFTKQEGKPAYQIFKRWLEGEESSTPSTPKATHKAQGDEFDSLVGNMGSIVRNLEREREQLAARIREIDEKLAKVKAVQEMLAG